MICTKKSFDRIKKQLKGTQKANTNLILIYIPYSHPNATLQQVSHVCERFHVVTTTLLQVINVCVDYIKKSLKETHKIYFQNWVN